MTQENQLGPRDDARGSSEPRPARWRAARYLLVGASLALISFLLVQGESRLDERANREPCAENLHEIGYAMFIYASRHGGKLPDDFATLLQSEGLPPVVFVCPNCSQSPPSGPTTRAVIAAMKMPGAVSYRYLGKGLTIEQADTDVVLAYEPLSNHDGRGMNVLFGDGHVEWIEGVRAKKLLDEVSSGARPVNLR